MLEIIVSDQSQSPPPSIALVGPGSIWGLVEHNRIYGKNAIKGGNCLSHQPITLVAIGVILYAILQCNKGKLRAPVCDMMDPFLNEKL